MAISPPSHATHNNAYLFQPPKSSASTTASHALTNSNDYFSAANSRKRQRPDSASNYTHKQEQEQIPRTEWTSTWKGPPGALQYPTPNDEVYGSAAYDHDQGSGLVNERYRLANGFDTPSLLHTSTQLDSQQHDEHDFRTNVRDDTTEEMNRFVSVQKCAPIFGPLARERNGAGRMSNTGMDMPRTTWTGLAFGAIGLVGKVFSFGSTVFRGFTAGGGRGYDVSNPISPSSNDNLTTPIPGSWQNDEFLGDFEQDSPTFASSFVCVSPVRPPNKRRQTDRDSWVMVGHPDPEPTTPPAKRTSRTVSHYQHRSSLAPPRSSASRASGRRSLAPSAIPRGSKASFPFSPTGSPPRMDTSSRRASVASPRSSGYFGNAAVPMSPEAERFAKRQAKQDRAVEKSMSSMEQRMKEMIRQAQEALGTKVEIENEPGSDDGGLSAEEDGFVDEDEYDHNDVGYRDAFARR